MAAIFYDSFDHYATNDLTKKWTHRLTANTGNDATAITSGGRRSTNCLQFRLSSGITAYTQTLNLVPIMPAPSGDVFVVGFAFTPTTLSLFNTGSTPGPIQNCICAVLSATGYHVTFQLLSNGTIRAYRGSGSSNVLGTSTPCLSAGVTAYLEFKVLIDNAAGTVEIRRDGETVLNLTGQNTRGTGSTDVWDELQLGPWGAHPVSGTSICSYDDFYLNDGTGGSRDDFEGDIAVDAIFPNANGTNRDGTPSTGSDEYAMVDETDIDEDTTYNTLAAVNDMDTLNYPDTVSGTVIGVQMNNTCRKTDATNAELAAVTRISGTDYSATSRAVQASYNNLRHIWSVKPSDSTVWLDSEVNAAEFGYEKTV